MTMHNYTECGTLIVDDSAEMLDKQLEVEGIDHDSYKEYR